MTGASESTPLVGDGGTTTTNSTSSNHHNHHLNYSHGYHNSAQHRATKSKKESKRTRRCITLVAILTGLVLGVLITVLTAMNRAKHNNPPVQQIIVHEQPTTTTAAATTTGTTTEKNQKTAPSNDKTATTTTTTLTVEETVPSHRPVCEYYAIKGGSASADGGQNTRTPPRILQTSMLEPSKPWSAITCVPAPDASSVTLNAFRAPDAILQVNFSATTAAATATAATAAADGADPAADPGATTTTTTTSTSSKPILGFGGAFTEAAARNFHRLQPAGQETVLELLFGKTGLGYSLGRVPMHSCDFTVKSYNFDSVEDDFELEHFDTAVQHDVDTGMIDMIQRAVQKYRESWGNDSGDGDGDTSTTANSNDDNDNNNFNNTFRLYTSPWSPPAWMKRPTWEDKKSKHAVPAHASKMTYSATPNCLRDGVGPDSRYAAAWALYFSKYLTAYQAHLKGLVDHLWAVTVQNEPEFAAPWEACAYTAANMTDFVAYHLGPVLARDHPEVKILGFDHNKDHINHWAMTMLNGTDGSDSSHSRSRKAPPPVNSSAIAAQYLAGTAYHWYAGGAYLLSNTRLCACECVCVKKQ